MIEGDATRVKILGNGRHASRYRMESLKAMLLSF